MSRHAHCPLSVQRGSQAVPLVWRGLGLRRLGPLLSAETSDNVSLSLLSASASPCVLERLDSLCVGGSQRRYPQVPGLPNCTNLSCSRKRTELCVERFGWKPNEWMLAEVPNVEKPARKSSISGASSAHATTTVPHEHSNIRSTSAPCTRAQKVVPYQRLKHKVGLTKPIRLPALIWKIEPKSESRTRRHRETTH